jgi:predicted DNA-binding ribbon-helix-helix protein
MAPAGISIRACQTTTTISVDADGLMRVSSPINLFKTQALAVSQMAPDTAKYDIGASARPKKRSFSIAGHRTSISLEEPFWEALRAIAANESLSLAQLVSRIDKMRADSGLSGAIRVYVLAHYQSAAAHRERAAEG